VLYCTVLPAWRINFIIKLDGRNINSDTHTHINTDSVRCPTISGIGFTNQKIPVLYKFWPLKLSVNLGPSGKSLVQLYLYYFYSFIFTLTVLCTIVYVLYCIVVLVTVILCFIWLFGHFGRKVDN